MSASKVYMNYPLWIVFVANLVSLTIYGTGVYLLAKLGWIFAGLYLLYVLTFEIRLIKSHCANCFYYGKVCAFGKGKVSSWFFKKGDLARFCAFEMTWKDLLPDLLISLIPFGVGIGLLFVEYDPGVFTAVLLLFLLTTFGNGYVRSHLACKYCIQRTKGCPAEKMFNKPARENLPVKEHLDKRLKKEMK